MSSIKVLGRSYRVKTDADPEHMQRVEELVGDLFREIQRNTPDTQEAAILAVLNLASDILHLREKGVGAPPARIQALIDLVESV